MNQVFQKNEGLGLIGDEEREKVRVCGTVDGAVLPFYDRNCIQHMIFHCKHCMRSGGLL